MPTIPSILKIGKIITLYFQFAMAFPEHKWSTNFTSWNTYICWKL